MSNIFYKILSFFLKHYDREYYRADVKVGYQKSEKNTKQTNTVNNNIKNDIKNDVKVAKKKPTNCQKKKSEFNLNYNGYAKESNNRSEMSDKANRQEINKKMTQDNTIGMQQYNIYHEPRKTVNTNPVSSKKQKSKISTASGEDESKGISAMESSKNANVVSPKEQKSKISTVGGTSESNTDTNVNSAFQVKDKSNRDKDSQKISAKYGAIQKYNNHSAESKKVVYDVNNESNHAKYYGIQKIESNGVSEQETSLSASREITSQNEKKLVSVTYDDKKVDTSFGKKVNVASPPIEKKNIDTKSNTVAVKKNAIDSMKQFQLSKNANIVKVGNTIQDMLKYFDEIETSLNDVINYVVKNNTVRDFARIGVCLNNYHKKISRLCEKLKSKIKSDDFDISEEVIVSIFNITSTDFIQLVMRDIYFNVLNSSNMNYTVLLKKLNVFLETLGAYTYSQKVSGDYVEDSDRQNYDISTIRVSDKNLFGKIKSIEIYPYRMNYYSYNGKMKYCSCLGSMIIYGKE